ncbi:ComEA family DNA-binding protein [Herminiimonas arsenitoxidans]|uniref:ComEA family DNA-binding protein n=1 Tax=Herminiimonas arsenitoxidans TaxID=1809410 RepID=UPI0009704832|nr:helix-hairpin-helix domain-containing protein [Herminiimonas arsenitoxidans]
MLKKLLLAIAMTLASISFAFADVDVNKADQAALDGIKGIGPATSKAILDERKKGGNFKDWADLEARVKGIGDKNSDKFSQAGLTVGGVSKPNAGKPAAQKPAAKTDTGTKTDASKSTAKSDTAKPAAKTDTSKPVTKADTSKATAKTDTSKPAAAKTSDTKSTPAKP